MAVGGVQAMRVGSGGKGACLLDAGGVYQRDARGLLGGGDQGGLEVELAVAQQRRLLVAPGLHRLLLRL